MENISLLKMLSGTGCDLLNIYYKCQCGVYGKRGAVLRNLTIFKHYYQQDVKNSAMNAVMQTKLEMFIM